MRKVVSVLLSAAMALSLCAGCSSSSSNTADTKAAEEKGADAADTEGRSYSYWKSGGWFRLQLYA